MSRQNQIFSALRASRTRSTTASRSAPALAAAQAASTSSPMPPHAVSPSITSTRSPSPRSASRPCACLAASHVPEMPPARWIETMSLPCSSSGSQTARKSPIEGCEVVGSSGSERQALVEGVEPVHLQLALGLALPADVQADLVDALFVRELARQVVRAVGYDRDGLGIPRGRYRNGTLAEPHSNPFAGAHSDARVVRFSRADFRSA